MQEIFIDDKLKNPIDIINLAEDEYFKICGTPNIDITEYCFKVTQEQYLLLSSWERANTWTPDRQMTHLSESEKTLFGIKLKIKKQPRTMRDMYQHFEDYLRTQSIEPPCGCLGGYHYIARLSDKGYHKIKCGSHEQIKQ